MNGIDWEGELFSPLMQTFGDPITFMPVVGVPEEGLGTLNESHEDLSILDDDAHVSAFAVSLGVNRADFLQAPKQGDKVLIHSSGETYMVRDTQPNGHGHILLLLNFDH